MTPETQDGKADGAEQFRFYSELVAVCPACAERNLGEAGPMGIEQR